MIWLDYWTKDFQEVNHQIAKLTKLVAFPQYAPFKMLSWLFNFELSKLNKSVTYVWEVISAKIKVLVFPRGGSSNLDKWIGVSTKGYTNQLKWI